MRLRALVMAATLLASSFAAVPATRVAAAAGAQTRGRLPSGTSYVLDPNPQIAAAAVSLWFRAPSDGYAGTTPGMSRLAATAAAATTLASGRSLADMVRQVGGQLAIEVYPDIVGIDVFVPASAARRVVASISAAYFTPAINAAGLKLAQRDAAVQAIGQHYSPAGLLHDALFAQLFSAGPAHTAPTPDTPNTFMQIPLSNVQSFAQRAFVSSNATLSLVGNVDTSILSAVAVSGKPGTAPAPIDSTLASAPIAVSTVAAGVSGLGLAWVGPPIHDEKAATALDFVSDYLFRYQTGVVARAVARLGGTYLNGQFITLHNPGVMLVTISGTHPKAAQTRVLAELRKLTRPLDAPTFQIARNAFLYHLAVDTQTPMAQADNLGWYAAEGNATYAPGIDNGRYSASARGLDAAFVASIVKKYLLHPVIVRLLPSAAKESST